jgi:hypothetical protein
MDRSLLIRNWLKGWLLSFAAFGVVALVLGGQFEWTVSLPWTEALRMAERDWLPWALIAPPIFYLVGRVPIERNRLKLAFAIHAACGAGILALCTIWAEVILLHFSIGPKMQSPPGPPLLVGVIALRLPVYLAIVSAAHAFYFYRRYQERERRNLSLEASLAKARLEALTAQLQPHFLFNSLNAIAELIHVNPDAADDMLAALSDLLRLTLETSAEQELPLRRELEFAERYLAIERVRFGKRLRTSIDASREVQDALVPTFLLQPLIENAIRHGLEPKQLEGVLTVGAKRVGGNLQLQVKDNGVGLRKHASLRKGIGLANVRARLQALYNGAARLDLRDSDGVIAEITIPFKTA